MSNGGISPGSSTIVDVVVDASVAVKWFVPENHSNEAIRLLDVGFRRHIPVLLHTEVGQTIWKKVHQRKEIGGSRRSIDCSWADAHPVGASRCHTTYSRPPLTLPCHGEPYTTAFTWRWPLRWAASS